MYKIGEFSKKVNIPVKTLRYYDEIGILQPVQIDPFTGYRFYDDNSVIECELIKLLKYVNFTLEEINKYKNNLKEAVFLNKQKEILEEIKFLRIKYEQLSCMINELKKCQIQEKGDFSSSKQVEKALRRKYERKNVG